MGLVNDHTTDCFCYPKKKGNWEVYIIKTDGGKLYTGITTDLERRFGEHKTKRKGARFFNFSNAEIVVYREKHPDRSSASQRENEIKKMNRKQKLMLLITSPNP